MMKLINHNGRTLVQLKEQIEHNCTGCYLDKFNDCYSKCPDAIYSNKIIVDDENVKLQLKRKGYKVKVRVLENKFTINIESEDFAIIKSKHTYTNLFHNKLVIGTAKFKDNITLPTEQEAIDLLVKIISSFEEVEII